MRNNIVAIVGRPNVGKSTLFNRLIGGRKAITDNISGVTRDRIYGTCEWNGKSFTVVDTGGFVHGSDDIFEAAIRSQVNLAIAEADVILFMVDTMTGITDLDDSIGNMLRRVDKPVFMVVNKADNFQRLMEANEFWSMGFEHTFFLSSLTGSGTGEVLDAVTDVIEDKPPIDVSVPKLAIVGRPNVGKSSFTNALLGEERNIVTDIAGTTRDSIHSHYNKFGMDFLIIDTAGIRRKSRVHEDLEFYSVMRAINALEEADVVMLMIDAQEGLQAQDLNLFRLAQKRNKGIMILVNKWDLVSKDTNTLKEYEEQIKERLRPFNDVPVVFISALDKTRIFKTMEVAQEVYNNRNKKIKTSVLNNWLQEVVERNHPPSVKSRYPKFKYMTQLPTYFPAFALFVNNPNYVSPSYLGYLENQLRQSFDFTGVPVALFPRKK